MHAEKRINGTQWQRGHPGEPNLAIRTETGWYRLYPQQTSAELATEKGRAMLRMRVVF
jgi:hypothetical protein